MKLEENKIDLSFIRKINGVLHEVYDLVKGVMRFPMRTHSRPGTEAAAVHEGYIKERFEKGKSNLFAYSIAPHSYFSLEKFQRDYILYKLYILGESVNAQRLEHILGHDILSLFLGARIFKSKGNEIRSLYRMIPFNRRLFLADLYNRSNENMVYLSYDSLFLSSYLSEFKKKIRGRKLIDNILDIACGSGIVGLSMAALSEGNVTVSGFDINHRAVEFSKINSLLNGVENHDYFVGNIDEPPNMEKGKPQCVLFNPPFIFMPNKRNYVDSYGGRFGIEKTLDILAYLDSNAHDDLSFCGIVASPRLDGDKHPVLVQESHTFKNLEITYRIVGIMPPFQKFKELYTNHKVNCIYQMIVTGERGGGEVTCWEDEDCLNAYCFG